ncbi:MAG: outer membrane protein assembly factor BamD [Sulfurimonas sp.]|nr:outer membrane protein assembly factor BamD [Sulfurimonas sp.]
MKFKTYILVILSIILILLSGCTKEVKEYNKPAFYWYSKIVEVIAQGDLEQADSYYSSLQGEHIGSPLLPEATMILALAHMDYKEYLLSEHFLDEYIKRYATANEKEEAEFLKVRAKYMALVNPRRDQALIGEALKSGEKFKYNYPNSMYEENIDTMLTRLYLAQAVLNKTIVDLYERLDKPKSAAYYRTVHDNSWVPWDDVNRADTPWYRAWFEGDGTSSWYAFMIPDTKSVVSRNSISEKNTEVKTEKVDTKTDEIIQTDDAEQEVVKEIQEKENNSSWYDFMIPTWGDDSEEDEEEIEEIQEKVDNSSWYDFMMPKWGDNETK